MPGGVCSYGEPGYQGGRGVSGSTAAGMRGMLTWQPAQGGMRGYARWRMYWRPVQGGMREYARWRVSWQPSHGDLLS
jgi:hypothetical protein